MHVTFYTHIYVTDIHVIIYIVLYMNATSTYCIQAGTFTTYKATAAYHVICYSYTSTYNTSSDYI